MIARFKKIPYAERLSLDEQMCSTKAKNYLRQYMPAKPNIGRSKIKIKTRKWYLRIFYHLIDLTVINAWIIYRQICTSNNIEQKDCLTLIKFKIEVAEILCSSIQRQPKRGRPSLYQNTIDKKKNRTIQVFHQRKLERTIQIIGQNGLKIALSAKHQTVMQKLL